MNVRVSAKAVIIRDNRLLVTRNVDHEGLFYLLPGGGQRPGEPLPAAVRRECREEIGADVEVHELLFVREYIGSNHEFAAFDGHVHQVELMFACTLPEGQVPRLGSEPDVFQRPAFHQIGVEWLEVDRLAECRFYPRSLVQALLAHLSSPLPCKPVYLGDVN